MENAIFERDTLPTDIEQEVRSATSFADVEALFRRLFPGDFDALPDAYKGKGDYGLKVRGVKAREAINAKCKEILERVHGDPSALTEEDKEILRQYSGRGGTSDNSQFEYYTPKHVAEGVWDAMKANGFENGNCLDPCCGAGIFSGTKPSGVIMTANDIDPTSSGVAALLNPEDSISTAPFEEVVMSTEDSSFDSCIGNVPFGNARGKSMHLDPAYKQEKSIERYFILRALDKIRPGGLACLICPTNIVGNKGARWEKFRCAVSRKAEFLGAHKLPSKTFHAQGTDTVVDVVVFRKHGRDLLNQLEADTIPTDTLINANVYWQEFIQGRYWQGEGKKFIMGTYTPKVPGDRWSREIVDGDIDNEGLKRKLAQKFESRIKWDVLDAEQSITRNYAEGDRRYINGDPYEMRSGQWVKVQVTDEVQPADDMPERYGAASLAELQSLLSDNQGALSLKFFQAKNVLAEHPELMTQQMKDAVAAADAQEDESVKEQVYRGSIIGAMLAKMGVDEEGGDDVSVRRETLQNIITAEIEKYGLPLNNKLSLLGSKSRAFGVFLNAVDRNGNFSALLSGDLNKARATGYRADSVADIANHLIEHLDNENVTLEDIKQLYTGKLELNDLGDVAQLEDVAITPEGNIEPLDMYCSGNVIVKVGELTEAIANETDARVREKFQKQIDEMVRRIPPTNIEDISFGLRNKWFSPKYVVEFLRENGYPNASYMVNKQVERESYDGTVEVVEELVEDFDAKDGQFYLYPSQTLKPKEFDGQFQSYLNGGKITSSDKERIAQYKQLAQEEEELFNSFMKMHIDSDKLAKEYSIKFKGFTPRTYNEEKLDIDEYLSGEISPHTYQNAEVRRLSDIGCGICGFGTGLGKSFTALAMAAYNHKHGKANRTCIIVPSAVLENWYHEARVMYSEEYMKNRVFFVGLEPKKDKDGNYIRKPILDENGQPRTKKDGTPLMQDDIRFANSKEEIYEAMWKIPQSNFSLVVMTKEKFKTIPIQPETLNAYTKEMVGRALMSEKAEKKLGKSYKEDVHQTKLEEKFSNERTEKKTELPYLEDMGFDSIITDESHFFKNSMDSADDAQKIIYVPDPNSSAIAVDMAIKSHYIRTKMGGRGVYGLTATPVTNSPIEIFNMLNLVAPPSEFLDRGITTPQSFIDLYGKVELITRINVAQESEEKDALVGFKNLDGLRSFFLKYVNIKTIEDVDDVIHVPNANPINEDIQMSPEQEEAYEELKAEAAASAQKKNGSRPLFSVMRDMDRCTTDMDLFKRQMTFVFSKEHLQVISASLGDIKKDFIVKETNEVTHEKEETKVHFDPKVEDNGDTFSLIAHELQEESVLALIKKLGIPLNEVNHPISPKYAKLIENAKRHLEASGKQLVFTEERSQHAKLARILVHNLPITDTQVGIINAEDASGDKLDKISKAYNAGSIKIVVANKKAEVGVNLQQGTTAIHHLTLPWTPASINQRNGRGVRQGNKVDSVDVYYYMGKGTFDMYRKQLLAAKSNWINELLQGKENTAENADASADEELIAVMSGNIEEFKRKKAEAEAKKANRVAQQYINRLAQVLAINVKEQTFDDRLEAKKREINHDIQSARYRLDSAKMSGKTEAVERIQKKLDNYQAALTKLEERFNAEREDNATKKKALVNLLHQAAKDSKLPFNAALIDHPEDCIVSIRGVLFEKDAYYEYGKKDETVLFKVIGIYPLNRQIKCIFITDNYDQTLHVDKINNVRRVTIDESEISLRKLLAHNLEYKDLYNSGITKEQFLENLKDISFRNSEAIYYGENGQYQFISRGRAYDEVPVWPDPSDQEFRTKALKAYIAKKKEAMFSTYEIDSVCKKLFGENFAEELSQYENNASAEQIHSMVADTFAEAMKNCTELQKDSEAPQYMKDVKILDMALSSFAEEVRAKFKSSGYDNRKDLESCLYVFREAKEEELSKLEENVKLQRRIEAEKKIEALKAENPDYKALTPTQRDEFAKLHIKAEYNMHEEVLPGARSITLKPFGRLFLYDNMGYNGCLRKSKEELKSKFGAKYTKDRPGTTLQPWWHVSADTGIEVLLEVLRQYQ